MSTLSFTSEQAGANSDYLRYLGDNPKKNDQYQNTTLLDFTLIPYDSAFVKLNRGAYIKLDSVTYPNWFTGNITNDPELTYLGEGPGKKPVYGYKYEASADEYVLTLKYIGVIPTFYNQTMGQILKALVAMLMPNTFDVSGIQDGPLVAMYIIDPKKRFLDVCKDFMEGASYVFWGNNKKLYFEAQDTTDKAVTLDAHDKHFTPARFTMKPSTAAIFNDIVVLGTVEPQGVVTEYFVGTGLDATFPLVATPFGSDVNVLLQDDFSSNGISTQNWIINDPAAYFKVATGYLNVLGGSGNQSYDTNIYSAFPIPMEGNLRLTHGEWDFLGGEGIVGGLWTQPPNQNFTGLLYGLIIANYTMNPIVGGVLDSTQAATINNTKRYVLRTIANFGKLNRTSQTYSYIDDSGAVKTITGAAPGDTVTWSTIITEVDPVSGAITNQWNFRNDSTLTGQNDSYAAYYAVASNDLHAAFTNITISNPLNASLEVTSILQLVNGNFDLWSDPSVPDGWTNPVQIAEETALADSGNCLRMNMGTGGVGASIQQGVSSLLQPNTPYSVFVKMRQDAWHNAKVTVSLTGTGITEQDLNFFGINTPGSTGTLDIDGTWRAYSGVLTPGLATIPPDLALTIKYKDAPDNSWLLVDNLAITPPFTSLIVGANEMDAMDGLAPSATIISSNLGAATTNPYTGSPQYNAGQSQLVFFKDSITRTSDVPAQNQIIRLRYRNAGIAVGRSVDLTSINQEASEWGDDGHRTDIRDDLVPKPRNSAECEMAAAALVSENAYTHYEGSYQQFSLFFTAEPRSGYIVKLVNIDGLPDIAEEINQVTSTLLAKTPTELFDHQITYGKPDHVRRMLSRFGLPQGTYIPPTQLTYIPAIDVRSSSVYALDVVKPTVIGYDQNNVYIDAGQDLPAGSSFEVRYSDASWGVDAGNNLCQRAASRYFSVSRQNRGKVFFMRQVDYGNMIVNSEDLTTITWSTSGATATLVKGLNPDQAVSQISSVAFAAGGSIWATITTLGSNGARTAFSASVKGPAGKVVTLKLSSGETLDVKLTGYWQRATVSGLASGGIATITCPTADTVQVTRCSAELGSSETLYCRTTFQHYGPSSRFTTLVNASFPSDFFSSSGEADTIVYPVI